jgi:hypothetical protein
MIVALDALIIYCSSSNSPKISYFGRLIMCYQILLLIYVMQQIRLLPFLKPRQSMKPKQESSPPVISQKEKELEAVVNPLSLDGTVDPNMEPTHVPGELS